MIIRIPYLSLLHIPLYHDVWNWDICWDTARLRWSISPSPHPTADQSPTKKMIFLAASTRHFCRLYNVKFSLSHMAVCQNLVPLVNIKIAGKWMFIPLKMVCIGIDPYPYWDSINPNHWHSSRIHPLGLNNRHRLSKTYVQLPVERLQAHIWPHALCGT